MVISAFFKSLLGLFNQITLNIKEMFMEEDEAAVRAADKY